MPAYIVLINSTQKGLANPKTLAKDVESANAAVEGFGGRLLDWNLTLGPYDAVAKVDFLDDKALAAFALALAANGNKETVTMRAYSLDEVKEIVAKIPYLFSLCFYCGSAVSHIVFYFQIRRRREASPTTSSTRSLMWITPFLG